MSIETVFVTNRWFTLFILQGYLAIVVIVAWKTRGLKLRIWIWWDAVSAIIRLNGSSSSFSEDIKSSILYPYFVVVLRFVIEGSSWSGSLTRHCLKACSTTNYWSLQSYWFSPLCGHVLKHWPVAQLVSTLREYCLHVYCALSLLLASSYSFAVCFVLKTFKSARPICQNTIQPFQWPLAYPRYGMNRYRFSFYWHPLHHSAFISGEINHCFMRAILYTRLAVGSYLDHKTASHSPR